MKDLYNNCKIINCVVTVILILRSKRLSDQTLICLQPCCWKKLHRFILDRKYSKILRKKEENVYEESKLPRNAL